MSKKSIGTGITRLLFGLKGKDLKVIPYNEMSPQQFEQLDRLLGKVGFILASDNFTLTKQQSDYLFNQIKQLDLYRERIMPGKNPDFKDFIPRDNLGIPATDKANEFKGFKPKVIQGGKPKIIQPKNAKQDVIDANENLAGGANYAKGDTKYNADVLADEIARIRGVNREDLLPKERIKFYSEAYDYLTEFNRLNRSPKKEGIKSLDLAKELEELTNKNLKERGLGEIKLGDDLPPPKNKKPAVDPELQKSEDRKKMIEDFKKRNDMEDRAIEDFVDDAGGVDPDDPRGIDDFIKGPEPDDFDAAKGGIARVGMNRGGKLFKYFL